MITNDLKQIVLLNPVKINYDLKKWKPQDYDKMLITDSRNMEGMAMSGGSDIFPANANMWDGVPFVVQREFRSPFWRAVTDAYIRFRLLFSNPKKDSVEFFMEVKDNFEELQKVEIDDVKIREMVTNLEKTRQKYAISILAVERKLQDVEHHFKTTKQHIEITEYPELRKY